MVSWLDSIPTPTDANGCAVPLNTEVLYDSNGKKVNITSFHFMRDAHGRWAYWKVFSPDVRGEDGMLYVDGLYLTPPDSWERLERDVYHLVMSEYLETPADDVKDLVRRAKALAERDAKASTPQSSSHEAKEADRD